MAKKKTEGKVKDYGVSKETVDSIKNSLDRSMAFGTGILKGGASLVDLPVSVFSSPFRDWDPKKNWFQNIVAGYTPLNDKLSEYGLNYKPETTAGRYLQSVGEFVPGGAIGKAPALVKGAGILAGGLGSEALGDLAERFVGKEMAPYARILGGLAFPVLASRAYNRFVGIPNAVLPETLSPKQQEQINSIAGNKLFEKPLMDYATKAEKAKTSADEAIIKGIGEDLKDLKSLPKQTLENVPIDTKDLISRLKAEKSIYQQNVDSPVLLDRSKYLDKIANQAENLSVEGLNALRQDIGKKLGKKAGASEAYAIVSEFLEQRIPNYRQAIGDRDLSRQVDIVSKELAKNMSRKEGDIEKAFNQATKNIENKEIMGQVDVERLIESGVPGADKLQNILSRIESYNNPSPFITADQISRAQGARSLSSDRGYISKLTDNKSLLGAVKQLGSDILMPNAEQQKFMALTPEKYASLINQGVRGGVSSTANAFQERNPVTFPATEMPMQNLNQMESKPTGKVRNRYEHIINRHTQDNQINSSNDVRNQDEHRNRYEHIINRQTRR